MVWIGFDIAIVDNNEENNVVKKKEKRLFG